MTLIPHICVTLLTLMVFGLCYMLAVAHGRNEALERHDGLMREILSDTRAERDEAWRFFHNADERISALLVENTRMLVENAYLKRGQDAGELDAMDVLAEVEAWLS